MSKRSQDRSRAPPHEGPSNTRIVSGPEVHAAPVATRLAFESATAPAATRLGADANADPLATRLADTASTPATRYADAHGGAPATRLGTEAQPWWKDWRPWGIAAVALVGVGLMWFDRSVRR